MKIRNLLSLIAAAAISAPLANAYVVTLDVPESLDGATAILAIDSPVKATDSVTITDSKAVFTGSVTEPYRAIISVDDQQVAGFFISQDSITIKVTRTEIPGGMRTDWDVTGGDLNKTYFDYFTAVQSLMGKRENSAFIDSVGGEQKFQEWLNTEFEKTAEKYLNENIDNAFGAAMATQLHKDEAFFNEHSSLRRFPAVQRYFSQIKARNATKPGQPFVDFTIDFNGEKHSLSDIAGRGKYILVDFWASWCGPCRASMPALRELMKEFEGKPFEIVGIPVNDNPDDTRRAVEELGITWPVWYTAKSDMAPAEAYSVNSIPSTFLIGPDGKILLNRPTEAELRRYLRNALGQ